jgi:hypothetical protein
MKILFNILVNVLGIITFFWVRFTNRTDKTIQPTFKYWWKDNYEQLISVVLVDAMLMIFVFMGGLKLNLEKFPNIPEWVQLTGDSVMFGFTGLFFAYLAYEAYKKMIIDKR